MTSNLKRAAVQARPDGEAFDLAFAHDVLDGLSGARKHIPCTWLYDHRGSELFEAITRVPEYYPTRTEIAILDRCAGQIAAEAGSRATVVELGSGSSRKTPILLSALDAPALYVPVDISARYLDESVHGLQARFPALPMVPLVADFTRLQVLPPRPQGGGRRVVFFPGSTIGNFAPDEAVGLLERIGRAAGEDALLVIGADATQDPALLLPAYDDRQEVTAAFNKNLLARVNRELDGDFDLDAFRHEARFDARQHRVEMHLVSLRAQQVRVLGRCFEFAAGESIHTENSYKHPLLGFQALAGRAGWTARQRWMDGRTQYAVHVFARSR